jgi:hypothetical protein
MDKRDYSCIVCGTERYIIFPNRNESYTICSGCYNIKIREEEDYLEEQEKKEKKEKKCERLVKNAEKYATI